MNLLAPSDLTKLLEGPTPPLLLDVRLADDHEAAHIPHSANNCVFEVSFLDRLQETATVQNTPIVVIGSSEESQEAVMAAEKLQRAGYPNLSILHGGISRWKEEGLPLDQGEALPEVPTAPHGRLDLDLDECRLEWLGRNLLNKHHGTVGITGGYLDFENGFPRSGEVTFDLRSLKCLDLADSELHDVLIHHLQDHDFLDVEKYPEGKIIITSVIPMPDSTPGSPNLMASADLTLRGQTREIKFTATGGLNSDGKPAAQAAFSIDRTKWGIIYGSGRFFHRLAGHLVNDLVEFQVRILTK